MSGKKPLEIDSGLVEDLKWDDHRLIPGIVQDIRSGEILMVAWMNQESLERTLETGYATFWSRSRRKLWMKGETSGHTMKVRSILMDCDGDTLILLSEASGPACHTGRRSCFYRVLADRGGDGMLPERISTEI